MREKFEQKFGPLGEELIEALHRKKAESNPDYEGENPATTEEVINDLKKEGIIKETEAKKPFSEKDAKEIIKAALGKDVFEREEKGVSLAVDVKKENGGKFWREQQKEHFQRELKIAESRNDKAMVEYYRKKIADEELREQRRATEEKLQKQKGSQKEAQDISWFLSKKFKKETLPRLQKEIDETQSKTYGKSNIYTRESVPRKTRWKRR